MIVLCEICQVGLEVSRHGLIRRAWVPHPELAVHSITFNKALLALEHETRKSALLVRLDNLDLQGRRHRVKRVLFDKCLVGFRRVLKAFFL